MSLLSQEAVKNELSCFSKQYKKLQDNIVVDVDEAVITIADNPEIGERKKGDLAALHVY